MYWQVDLAPSPGGAPDRLMTCRNAPTARTALWRDLGESEQALLGIQYAGRVPEPRPLVVRNAGHWLWGATGAAENDELPGLVAGEADRYFPRTALPAYTDRMLLAHSPYEDAAGASPTRRPRSTAPPPAPTSSPPAPSPGHRPWTAPATSTRRTPCHRQPARPGLR